MLLAEISASAAAGSMKMAVISDVHMMAPSLLKQDGKALDDYIASDRKLLREGPWLVREAFARIVEEAPDVLLISGDLTKDGETTSTSATAAWRKCAVPAYASSWFPATTT